MVNVNRRMVRSKNRTTWEESIEFNSRDLKNLKDLSMVKTLEGIGAAIYSREISYDEYYPD